MVVSERRLLRVSPSKTSVEARSPKNATQMIIASRASVASCSPNLSPQVGQPNRLMFLGFRDAAGYVSSLQSQQATSDELRTVLSADLPFYHRDSFSIISRVDSLARFVR
jgi:hypothetical protein